MNYKQFLLFLLIVSHCAYSMDTNKNVLCLIPINDTPENALFIPCNGTKHIKYLNSSSLKMTTYSLYTISYDNYTIIKQQYKNSETPIIRSSFLLKTMNPKTTTPSALQSIDSTSCSSFKLIDSLKTEQSYHIGIKKAVPDNLDYIALINANKTTFLLKRIGISSLLIGILSICLYKYIKS